MPKNSLINFGITFGIINLLSALVATDWKGLYAFLVSGPACGLLIKHMRPLSITGFSESQFELVCFLVAIIFSALCSLLPKRYMTFIAGGVWVILGYLVAGLNGVFS
jgi:hypothetical protein